MGDSVPSDPTDLLNRFLASRNPVLREELVLQYVPLVHYVLGRLGFTQELGFDYEDLVSQGLLGLIEAVDRYNPSFGAQFRTYAVVRVRGKILDYLRTLDWLSRTERQRSRLVQKSITEFWLKNQRAPTDAEIGKNLNMGADQVQKALVDSSRVIVSLDETHEGDEDDESSLHEVLADEQQENPSDILSQEETMAQLVETIHGLDQREQLVLTLYYYEKLTFKEIGQVMDITESRVCQLHARAITSLRVNMQRKDEVEKSPALRKFERPIYQEKSQEIIDRRG
jgi:RNA polymerase sigma factor for flagellar operon FliA